MKHTKILATISDRNCDVKFLKRLFERGMDGVRLNTAHQMPEDALKVIKNVRKVSEKIPLVIDTKGPEVRTRGVDEEICLKKGAIVKIYSTKTSFKKSENSFYTSYPDFVNEIPVGKSIFIDDGKLEIVPTIKKNGCLTCKVMNNGCIKNNKSINIPGVSIKLPPLTEKDKMFIEFAIRHDLDFIAHSFVRNKGDVMIIQKILDKKKSKVKIIAKIENKEGVENIDEILDHVHGIMIARGDLAVELPAQRIPIVQKMLVKKCIKRKKLVITATEMLHTMIENPRPTRAEVSDIANAVYDGTDVLMLSGETAYGEYPEEAVSIMANIAYEVENQPLNKTRTKDIVEINDEIATFLSLSAINASLNLPLKAIIADTKTGRTALYLAAFRGDTPVFMQCYNKRVMRELALSYGIRAEYAKHENMTISKFIKNSLNPLLASKRLKKADLVLVLAGNFGPSHGASFIEISNVKNMLLKK